MICKNCIKANEPGLTEKQKKKLHDKCPGKTHCDCQHRVNAKTILKKEFKRDAEESR